MPHQCVRCGALYDDGAKEILQGCSKCGGRLFFYIKPQHLKAVQERTAKLSPEQKREMEKDILDIIGVEEVKEKPVVLDLESVRVLQPGKYEIDVVKLFNKQPIVFKIGEGRYVIDLIESFKSFAKNL